jgi:hypothetical protein
VNITESSSILKILIQRMKEVIIFLVHFIKNKDRLKLFINELIKDV